MSDGEISPWSDITETFSTPPRILTPFSPGSLNSSFTAPDRKEEVVRIKILIPQIGSKNVDGKLTIMSYIRKKDKIVGFATTTGENFYASVCGWLGTKRRFKPE